MEIFIYWFLKYFLIVLAVLFISNYVCDRIEQSAERCRGEKWTKE